MDDTSNEPHIIAASTLSSDSRELHFPNGLRPFEEVPMTEDGAEIDYYKVLGIDPDASDNDIRAACKNMLMFYHHDRYNRVFANYDKPEGFEDACQRVYDIVDQAKTVLTVSRKRWTYNFIHFSQDPMDRRLAYENDRENSINSIQNMTVSAQLIEETEAAKGSDGLNIICAYYGAIENSVDPNVSILDIVHFDSTHDEAFGPVLDVKIPLLCMMENSKIIHHVNASVRQQTLSSLPGFYDCAVGENKRLYVKYGFKNRLFVMNVAESDDFGIPQRQHMVLRSGEAPPEDKKKQKMENAKQSNRTYAIIMNEKPRHRFHLRYVVYSLGLLIGCNLLYRRNDTFRGYCDAVAASYRQGTLVQDSKSFFYNAYLAMRESIRAMMEKWVPALTN